MVDSLIDILFDNSLVKFPRAVVAGNAFSMLLISLILLLFEVLARVIVLFLLFVGFHHFLTLKSFSLHLLLLAHLFYCREVVSRVKLFFLSQKLVRIYKHVLVLPLEVWRASQLASFQTWPGQLRPVAASFHLPKIIKYMMWT